MGVVKLQPHTIPGISSIIGFISGKGGVGKTFITSQTAVSLARLGYKVGILDADMSYSNIFTVLGIQGKVNQGADGKFMPIEKFGVKCVAMAGLLNTPDEPIVWRGPLCSRVIQQLVRETVWGDLDFLLVDFPSGMTDHSVGLLQTLAFMGVVIVTTPQKLSVLDAKRTANAMDLFQVPVLGVVENFRGEIFGERGGANLAEEIRVPFLGSIPMRKTIVGLCDNGTLASAHSEEFDMLFTKIARGLLECVSRRV